LFALFLLPARNITPEINTPYCIPLQATVPRPAAGTVCGAVADTVNVEVADELPVKVTGVAEQEPSVIAAGTVQVKLMVPVKPLMGVIVNGVAAACPGITVMEDGGAAGRLKSETTTATDVEVLMASLESPL
jgi:hypothetical protein